MIDSLARMIDERFAELRTQGAFSRIQNSESPLLIVHQMGKVGSTALVDSIKGAKGALPWRVHQTHYLSQAGMALVEAFEVEAFGGWLRMPSRKRRLLARRRLISRRFARGDYAQFTIKLISLVRDPVATNVSGFFHNHHWWPKDLAARCRRKAPGWETQLLERFLSHYPHDVPATWFDLEMKGFFGIDVFQSDFDRQAGCQIYESGKYPLLLMRLENLAEPMQEAICEFLELDEFAFRRSNAASGKWYADLYRAFKDFVSLPASYLDRVYSAPSARYFYTASEIASFRGKWQAPESIVD